MKRMKLTLMLVVCIAMILNPVGYFSFSSRSEVHAEIRPADDAAASTLRVKLSTGDESEVLLTLNGIYSIESGRLDPGTYRVRNEGNWLILLDSKGNTLAREYPSIKIQEHSNTTPGAVNLITMNVSGTTRQYQGGMKFWANDATIETINHVYLEKYLYGVVGYEMSNSFPLEALKSQAVAARCYAVKRLDRVRDERFDIGDTSSDQVYKGFNSNYSRVIQAVDATAGQVLQYNGSIITAYYSASNGGQTERTENVWTAAEPFLKIRNDPYDLQNPSSLKRAIYFPEGTQQDKPAGNSADPTVSEVRYSEDDMDPRLVDFLRTMAAGMLTSKNATLPEGQKYLVDPSTIQIKSIDSMQVIQTTFNPYCKHDAASTDGPPHDASNCPSVDFTGVRMKLLLKVTRDNPLLTGSQERIDCPWEFEFVIPEYLRSTTYPQWYVFDPNYRLRIYAVEQGTTTSGLPAFILIARRYGHGVGLSQRGAQQRALDTNPDINQFQNILAFYYPGTQLSTIGLTDPILPPAPTTTAPALPSTAPTVSYRSHVQDIGWQDFVSNGAMSGTSGLSKRLEGMEIKLENVSGGIEYRTHVQDIGWMAYVANGAMSGTSGQSKRLEAINIRLTGEASTLFDIYYRVHAQEFGWLGWAKNDEPSGTAGFGYRLEAIEIVLVQKGGAAPGSTTKTFVDKYAPVPTVRYRTHVQDVGWQAFVSNGAMSGTSGQSKRLEGIEIMLENVPGGIEYRTHVQDYGWLPYVANGAMSGTSGQSKRLEAINIRLIGEAANLYDVYYRVHAQEFGWLGWAKNDEPSGTAGFSYRLEAIEIVLVAKGGAAPGSTSRTFVQK